ncbi:MAG TPA: glycosyltransferase, partial [Candidatus Udaeobacter sp.]|nr:glycosyltransferase [Candidatus Udaeobacter sp.]
MFIQPSTPAASPVDPTAEQLNREPIDQADARRDLSQRQFSLEMLSGTDLGNRYLTRARRAVFAIHKASGKPAAGWVRVSGRLESDRPVYLSIYARDQRSAEFTPVESPPVHLHLRAGRFEAIALSDGLTTLRCDAPHGDAEFTIDRLSIRRIGWLGVAGWRLSRLLHRLRLRRISPIRQLRRLSQLMCSRRGLRLLWALWLHPRADNSYEEWIELFDTLEPSDMAAIRRHVRQMTKKPKISVVMPTYNTNGRWLRMAIESVQAQLYDNWELCIADDASTIGTVPRILTQYAQRDSRIKVVYARKNGGIAEATNLALGIADGEFVALLDHDDIIPPHALYMVAQAIAE